MAIGAWEQAFDRATSDDYHAWLGHVTPAAGCTHPIRLHGELVTVDTTTGQLLDHTTTADMPDGVVYVPCGNRRASVCPTCAETYRRDAYELVRTGMAGGKTVPESVATHPAVFVTLTAPSFGQVHTRRTSRTGKPQACRPRRHAHHCPHGVDLRCHRLHHTEDPALGTPICPDCYDHTAQVVWNYHAGELWRRTRITADRQLTRLATSLGVPRNTYRLRYAKVAEFQARGVVHFHLIVRLDGYHPDLPDLLLPPPAPLTAGHLHQVLTAAVTSTTLTTGPHPHHLDGWQISWGRQIDIRPLNTTSGDSDGDQVLSHQAAAGYLAKYATKSTEATGHTSARLTHDNIGVYANPTGTHTERLVHACWTLSANPKWRGLRRWAHMLGYGGHFLTKARRWSVTFAQLRQRRADWRHHQRATRDGHNPHTTQVLAWLNFTGVGWKTAGDALLANTSAALARERAQAARDAHPITTV